MNREIEFRGQRIDNGEWLYGFLYQLPMPTGVGCMILTTDNTHEDNSIETEYHLAFTLWVDLFPVKPDTVGQFTGLRDKNGKKIYEGDVVDMRPRYSQPHRIEYICGQWICVDGCGGWVTLTEDEQLGDETNGVGVIGNIYDNPELLYEKE